MSLLSAALVGAFTTWVVGLLTAASVEIRRHDRQVTERDEDLEEWLVIRYRLYQRRMREVGQQIAANSPDAPNQPGTAKRSRRAVHTELLYELREEFRQADAFVLRVRVEERWSHGLVRWVLRQPFQTLRTPDRAARLIDYWQEGTERNALTWKLSDILAELPVRATSRALDPE